jgi:hypothetical protein
VTHSGVSIGAITGRISLSLLAAAALFSGAEPARAQAGADDVKPPFGLQWRESQAQIESKLVAAKATIVDRKEAGNRIALTAEGIIHAGLRRTIFYFVSDSLVEVELQYQGSDWDARKYELFLEDIRKKIESKFGPGQMLVNSQKPDGAVIQKLLGYKWTQTNTAIKLVFFSAEDADQIYRTISVHYLLQ